MSIASLEQYGATPRRRIADERICCQVRWFDVAEYMQDAQLCSVDGHFGHGRLSPERLAVCGLTQDYLPYFAVHPRFASMELVQFSCDLLAAYYSPSR